MIRAAIGFLAMTAVPFDAGAEELAIDLDLPREELPRWVCVVHATTSMQDLSTSLDPAWFPESATGVEGNVLSGALPSKLSSEALTTALDRLRVRRTQVGWFERVEPWDREDVACGDELQECLPSVTVPPPRTVGTQTKNWFVSCAENSQQLPAPGRVMVIVLRFSPVTEHPLAALTLQGSVIALGVGQLGRDQAVAQISGGDYLQGTAAPFAVGRARLAPQPRCLPRELRFPSLPDATTESTRLEVHREPIAQGAPRWRCVLRYSSRVPMWLPVGDSGTEKTFVASTSEATTPPGEGPVTPAPSYDGSTLVVETRWAGDVPPEELPVRVRRLRFSWSRICEYPTDTRQPDVCPDARLLEPDLECPDVDTRSKPGMCVYTCGSGRGGREQFDLPVTVRFSISTVGSDGRPAPSPTVAHQEAWRDVISAPSATLHSYTQSLAREVWVRFTNGDSLAKRALRPGDRITHVRIRGPRDLRHDLEPGDDQRIAAPFAACGDSYTYEFFGDRDFDSQIVRSESGIIELEPPDARTYYFGAAAGGGFGFVQDPERWAPFGAIEGTLRYWPADPPWAPFLIAGELQLEYSPGRWQYYRLRSSEAGAGEAKPVNIAENRAHFRIAMVARPWTVFELAVGAGAGEANPVLLSEARHAGDSDHYVTTAIQLRFQVARSFFLEGSVRWFGSLERRDWRNPDFDFRGEALPEEETLWSVFDLGAGIRYWIW